MTRKIKAPKTVAPKPPRKGPRRPDQTISKPNPNDRVCVKMGLARIFMRDGRVEYDWAKISELWLVDPTPNLATFCRKYDISYATATRHITTSGPRKRSIVSVVRGGYVMSVVRGLLADQTRRAEEDAEKISRAISELSVFSHSAAAFARARMIKVGPRGEEMVNIDAKASDVSYYSRIAREASETIKNLLTIRSGPGGEGDEAREITEMTVDAPAGTSSHEHSQDTKDDEEPGAPTAPDAQAPEGRNAVGDGPSVAEPQPGPDGVG